jgi:hypothetical protein
MLRIANFARVGLAAKPEMGNERKANPLMVVKLKIEN